MASKILEKSPKFANFPMNGISDINVICVTLIEQSAIQGTIFTLKQFAKNAKISGGNSM